MEIIALKEAVTFRLGYSKSEAAQPGESPKVNQNIYFTLLLPALQPLARTGHWLIPRRGSGARKLVGAVLTD